MGRLDRRSVSTGEGSQTFESRKKEEGKWAPLANGVVASLSLSFLEAVYQLQIKNSTRNAPLLSSLPPSSRTISSLYIIM